VGSNPGLVLEDSTRINHTRNRTARVDLLLHGLLAGDRPVVVDGNLRIVGNGRAEAARRGEGRTSSRDVDVGAGPVLALADAVLAFRGTGEVRVRRLETNALALLGELVEPLVGAIY